LKTPGPQFPGLSASLIETEETTENTEGGPDALEPVAKGDIQKENSSD
jgi:hypothetical protein